MHEQDQTMLARESRNDLCVMFGNAARQVVGYADVDHSTRAIGEEVYKIAPGHFDNPLASHRRLVRPRLRGAPLRNGYALHRVRGTAEPKRLHRARATRCLPL